MKRLILFFFLIINVAQAQQFLTETGYVNFLSKAPLSDFNGESKQLHGLIDVEKNMLDFYIDLNTLDTGIGLRDKHMRDNYLETEKFPFAEFSGKMSPVPNLVLGISNKVTASGKFKIHGIERQIEVKGTLIKNPKGEVELIAAFDILLSEYDIPVPKLVFYELAEKQEVTLKATLKPKK
jgi:polyisoprenoid-binding protein YceI